MSDILKTTPFYIEDISRSDNTVTIMKSFTSAPTLTIEKSTDGETWETMGTTSSTTAITATVPANGKLYLRSKTKAFGTYDFYNNIIASGPHNVGGNIMSLLYGSDFTGGETTFPSESGYTFYRLFDMDYTLVSAADLLLPATSLAIYCYSQMFSQCTSLTTAPALPATSLAIYCYDSMFSGCASLTTAPELPATTLVEGCYSIMFSGCSKLTTAPELPATSLAIYCYSNMFADCTSLTTAPALPATSLAEGCYYQMFSGCTSLTEAPELPATSLVYGCYFYMFENCTSLNSIVCLANNIPASNCTTKWLYGVIYDGTFYAHSDASWTTGINGIPDGWTMKTPVSKTTPFYIEDVSGSTNTVTIMKDSNDAPTLIIEKSLNGKSWETMGTTSKTAITATVPANGKLYLRCSATAWGRYDDDYDGYNAITASGRYNVGGNIMSLLYGESFTGSEREFPSGSTHSFYYLLAGDTNLVSAADLSLPATTLAKGCYNQTFNGCASLTTAPTLPATTLAENCYSGMFAGCTSLTTAPELPATTLAEGCYNGMFLSCTSLTEAPALPATTLANSCYNMMFQSCSSLTTAPELPATTLAKNCYLRMFRYCDKLNSVTCMATDISASDCTIFWLQDVSPTGTFYTPSATNWTTGTSGIPEGWTRVGI